MIDQRYLNNTALTDAPPLSHTLVLRAKSDGYHIYPTGTLNKYGSVLIVSSSDADEVRSLVEFDVASLPDSATITRITLQLHVVECRLANAEDAMTLCCYGYIGDGHVTADDASAGIFAGGISLDDARLSGLISVDIAPEFVQRAKEAGYVGFRLQTSASDTSTFSNCLVLRSLENINPDSTPLLFLDYAVEEIVGDTCIVATRPDMAP